VKIPNGLAVVASFLLLPTGTAGGQEKKPYESFFNSLRLERS
jgi:hypothetical protein